MDPTTFPNDALTQSVPMDEPPVMGGDGGGKPTTITPAPKVFKAWIEACKRKRRELVPEWAESVNYRRGKPGELDNDETRTPIPVDWWQTKSKGAQLFSQVPKIIASADDPDYKAAAAPFQRRLNQRLKEAKVGTAMFEAMSDILNASGFGAIMVSMESTMEYRDVPTIAEEDLSLADRAMVKLGIKKIPTESVPFPVDKRFMCRRLSPADLLWDVTFKGSDWDECPFLGHSGRFTWAEGKKVLRLKDEDKEKIITAGDGRREDEKLTDDQNDRETADQQEWVYYDEIFYFRYRFHEDETSFSAIQRMVFVDGMTEPVINEPWKGQELTEDGQYAGACKYPIRIGTLVYISDEAIPPSDSAVIRPQVNELIKSRQQMADQRDLSKPIRWYDVNRVDADIQTMLMIGDYQGFIPTQGDGSRALGEVARANYPRENYDIDRIIKGDIMETSGVGPNQSGTLATGERSAAEAKITQGNFSTRIGQERARMVEMFVGIAEVMAGLMVLYDDGLKIPKPQPQPQAMPGAQGSMPPMPQPQQYYDLKNVMQEMVFTIRGDSTVLLDAEQRIERLMRLLNMVGKSGYFNPLETITELVSLHDVDPTHSVQAPQPKPPEGPAITYKFSGEDLNNPMVIALLIQSGHAPTPQQMEAAKAVLISTQTTPRLPDGTVPGVKPVPKPGMSDDRPDWQAADRINTRRDASQE